MAELKVRVSSTVGLLAAIGCCSAVLFYHYLPFTADDAYIYMRYGANLVDWGELSFNRGEPISTMTAPLLALLNALLYAATGSPRVAYKVISLLCLLASTAIVLRRTPDHPWLRGSMASILWLSPPLVLWTVGGMETPLLMLLATASASLALGRADSDPRRCRAVLLLAGVAYVTRQDSALFMSALCLQVLTRESWRTALGAISLGALIPVAWTLVSLGYFGDLFPNSYYVKTPTATLRVFSTSAPYIAQFLVLTGLVPLAAMLLFEAKQRGGRARGLGLRLWARWGLVLAILLQLTYGLTSATVHMMFSFRFFVPYIPSVLLLLADCAHRGKPGAPHATPNRLGLAFTGLLSVFLIAHAHHTYHRSVQGYATKGELIGVSVADFMSNMAQTEVLIQAVQEHWESLPKRPREHPRIRTWAEGLMPFLYRDAYFFGTLVSYRHGCKYTHKMADYSLRAFPRRRPDAVASLPVEWGGKAMQLTAVYNPHPLPNPLPPRVGGLCLAGSRGVD